MGRIMAVCISEKRGTAKKNVKKAKMIPGFGLEGDAHGGDWHRQVSLLSYDRVAAFNAAGGGAKEGDFGENLLVQGIDFRSLPVGTRLRAGEVELEITQIGKECHTHCEIFKRVGRCIMPTEGVFARVLQGGAIEVGGEMQICTEQES